MREKVYIALEQSKLEEKEIFNCSRINNDALPDAFTRLLNCPPNISLSSEGTKL